MRPDASVIANTRTQKANALAQLLDAGITALQEQELIRTKGSW